METALKKLSLLLYFIMVVVLLSFINHSSKSNHSVLETFLLLYLLNSWQLNLLLATKKTIFLNIYRPPSSKISTFFDEFQNLLEFFVPLPSELIITGDFNIHTDSDLTTPNKFSCILDNFHLKQHIHIFLLMMTATLLIFS